MHDDLTMVLFAPTSHAAVKNFYINKSKSLYVKEFNKKIQLTEKNNLKLLMYIWLEDLGPERVF